jgi:hypothetical protein
MAAISAPPPRSGFRLDGAPPRAAAELEGALRRAMTVKEGNGRPTLDPAAVAESENAERQSKGGIEGLIGKRVAAATEHALEGPNQTSMRVQKPVWDVLCKHYFRLDTSGWERTRGAAAHRSDSAWSRPRIDAPARGQHGGPGRRHARPSSKAGRRVSAGPPALLESNSSSRQARVAVAPARRRMLRRAYATIRSPGPRSARNAGAALRSLPNCVRVRLGGRARRLVGWRVGETTQIHARGCCGVGLASVLGGG